MAHDKETRAATMAALLSGQSIDQAADEYQVPRSTVGRWRKKAFSLVEDADLEDAPVKEIGDLLLHYLRQGLATVAAQHEVFADSDWLRDQDASEAAVLHGVLLDKIVRLLEAMEGAPVESTPSSNGKGRVAGRV